MFDVFILKIVEDLFLEKILSFGQYVACNKQERISKFRFAKDKQNTLLGDLMVRSELCKRTHLKNRQLEFATNLYGKPCCINVPEIQYNISHSGQYVACAFSDNPVGIDIEVIQDTDLQLADKFFTEDEREYIHSSSDKQRGKAFYEIWTKKESYLKYLGTGISASLTSFSVLQHQSSVFYYLAFSNSRAICHVCSPIEQAPSIKVVPVNELLSYFQNS